MFSEEMICSLNDLELEVYKYVVRNADKVCYCLLYTSPSPRDS